MGRRNDYDFFMGRWSRLVADAFVRELDTAAGLRWLDVGCGTGALLETVQGIAKPAVLAGVDPSDEYVKTCRDRLGPEVDVRVAEGEQLPFDSRTFDVVVSGLVVNFIPDPLIAVQEWRRVTETNGLISAYVWDYAYGMEFLRYFWDVVVEMDPAARHLDEAVRFPICQPRKLTELFEEAGLSDVTTGVIDIDTTFASFDDYWAPFLRGQGPAPSYISSLTEAQQRWLMSRLRAAIPHLPDGTVNLLARAWTVTGTA